MADDRNPQRGMTTLEGAIRRRMETEIHGIGLARAAVESDSPEWLRLTNIEDSLRGVLDVLGPAGGQGGC